jgi:2-C-methyl-D-erythritol 2,4-cyclodiphosphate synthase
MRIGQGVDVHAFSEDPARELVLGGITIDGSRGLAGNSDADVVCHALCDAVLGAAGLGDLGRHFPDDDPAYAGADSIELLAYVVGRARALGWSVANADCTVIAQRPRLAPHLDAMTARLGAVLEAPVNVKATTTEQLGALGRGEGIGATAVVLLESAGGDRS